MLAIQLSLLDILTDNQMDVLKFKGNYNKKKKSFKYILFANQSCAYADLGFHCSFKNYFLASRPHNLTLMLMYMHG